MSSNLQATSSTFEFRATEVQCQSHREKNIQVKPVELVTELVKRIYIDFVSANLRRYRFFIFDFNYDFYCVKIYYPPSSTGNTGWFLFKFPRYSLHLSLLYKVLNIWLILPENFIVYLILTNLFDWVCLNFISSF